MSWSVNPSDFIVDVEEDLGQLRTEIALRAHRGIVLRMPVDTGRARGSTNLSYSAPNRSIQIDSANGVIGKGMGTLASRAKNPYEIVYVFTAVPYIGKLEFGPQSKQAPQGVYRITVAALKARYGK